jgi:hypothetical protein
LWLFGDRRFNDVSVNAVPMTPEKAVLELVSLAERHDTMGSDPYVGFVALSAAATIEALMAERSGKPDSGAQEEA